MRKFESFVAGLSEVDVSVLASASPRVARLEMWEDLVVRTEYGTVLFQLSMDRFRHLIENFLWSKRTGLEVAMSAHEIQWCSQFIRENGIDVRSLTTKAQAAMFSTAEKQLTEFVKKERATLAAKEALEKRSAAVLHNAFVTLGKENLPRDVLIAIAVAQLGVDATQMESSMDHLKGFLKSHADTFAVHGKPFRFVYRLRDERGRETGVELPEGAGSSPPPSKPANPAKPIHRYTLRVRETGLSEEEFRALKGEHGEKLTLEHVFKHLGHEDRAS